MANPNEELLRALNSYINSTYIILYVLFEHNKSKEKRLRFHLIVQKILMLKQNPIYKISEKQGNKVFLRSRL